MRLTFLAIGILLSASTFAQSKNGSSGKYGQSFYAELGGPGILFSANYDRRFTKSNLGLGGRIGLGFVTGYEYTTTIDPYGYYVYSDRQRSVLTVPVQVNYLFGKPNSVSAFEVGLGATFTGKKLNIFDNYYYGSPNEKSSLYGTASFMYRRMPKEGGFSWRLGFTPIFTKGYIQPSGGVSVGYNF